jgi:hypothetical protein
MKIRAEPMLRAGRDQAILGKFAHAIRAQDRPEHRRTQQEAQEA